MNDKLGKYLLNWRVKTVLPYIEGKLLDIGCGTNHLVKNYSGDGVGVDVYKWDNVDLVVENTADLPYKNNSFDTVTILAALNHIPNRTEVLSEANRVLKKEGKLIITMIPPTISAIWHKIREPWDEDQHERGMKEGEVYGLTHKQIKNLLSEAGFRISYTKRFMLKINLLVVSSKSK